MKCVMPAFKEALQTYMVVHSSFIRSTMANWVAAKVYGQKILSLQQAQRRDLLNIIMGHRHQSSTESYTWVRMVSGQVASKAPVSSSVSSRASKASGLVAAIELLSSNYDRHVEEPKLIKQHSFFD